jgi:hypothetical protein
MTLTLALTGCAASATGMRPVDQPSYAPRHGAATVVFVRDYFNGRKINFPIVDEKLRFVGNVRGNQHAIAQVPAGSHTFYVIAETAELVRATLEAGAVYVISTRPRAGWGKLRVSARPASAAEFADFWQAVRDTTAMVPEPSAGAAWVAAHRASIAKKLASAEQDWQQADVPWRQEHTLSAKDGRPVAELGR